MKVNGVAGAVFLAFSLLLTKPAGSEITVEKIIAHCPDQENILHNDPKWIWGTETRGQIFVPSQSHISYLRVNIRRIKEKVGKVTPFQGEASLELRLWKCRADYKATTESLPLVFTTDTQPVPFTGKTYFLVDKDVEPGKPYYFEFSVPMAPAPCYYYWYQYQGNPYSKGTYIVNGNPRGGCALDFTTYYPLELKNGEVLNVSPALFEVRFSEKVVPENLRMFISGPSGVIAGRISAGEKNTAYLEPLKPLSSYALNRVDYRLIIQVKTEKDEWRNFSIPFVYEKPSVESTGESAQ